MKYLKLWIEYNKINQNTRVKLFINLLADKRLKPFLS
jgi:hypothetical protein